MTDRTAIAGGRGFIGSHLTAAIPGSFVFGREGPPPRACEALVWAAGGRAGSAADLHDQHTDAPLRAIAALRPRRVVYLSSAEVYGQQPVPFSETTAPAPTTDYGHAKLDGELAVTAACAAAGIQLFIVRPAIVYGPGQAPTMLIPAALAALRAGQRFPATDGAQTRDFLHVDDLVALVLRCLGDLANPGHAPPDTYNAGSGRETSVRDVLRSLADAVGPAAADLLAFGARAPRVGEAVRYVLDIRRARERLRWSPAIDLEIGLRRLAATAASDPVHP
jgi:nucleoside-diphosphate-sugar epimerase